MTPPAWPVPLPAVLRLGFLADLLSRPVIVGYPAGVALIMITGQLGAATGVPVAGEGFHPCRAGQGRRSPAAGRRAHLRDLRASGGCAHGAPVGKVQSYRAAELGGVTLAERRHRAAS